MKFLYIRPSEKVFFPILSRVLVCLVCRHVVKFPNLALLVGDIPF